MAAARLLAARFRIAALAVIAALPATACSNDDTAPANGGAGGKGSPSAAVPCLERPNELPRPPQRGLPCDLLPPTTSSR